MKLWLLRPVGYPDNDAAPWRPWFDKAFGFVVRAETEAEARLIAQNHGGDEVRESASSEPAWINPEYSTCVELTADGEASIVIRDFASA